MKFNMIVLMTSCDPKRAFNTPGIAPQKAPASIAASKQNGTRSHGLQVCESNSNPRGCKRSDVELAFRADVEQAATKTDEHGEAGEDQRSRVKECVADAVGPRERAAQQQPISDDRIVADEQYQNAADDESGHHGDQWEQKLTREFGHIGSCTQITQIHQKILCNLWQILMSSRHQQSNLFERRNFRIDFTGYPAFVNYQQTIGQTRHLFQLGRDEQDRATVIAQGDQLPMNELDRADIDAARRLRHEQQLWIDAILAADDQLLLVAAGERTRRAASAFGGRTSNSLMISAARR